MLFNSFQFLLFYPLVTFLYFVLPHRARWALLLIASCYFYMAFVPVYILILLFTILVDYSAGLLIEGASGGRRRLFLLASLAANVGVLAFFKYFNFVNANMAALAEFLRVSYPIPFLRILLPISLSFHTFQSMAYTIEVYRGRQPAERHLGIFALYVMFYPQLVAGPIERPQNLIHQFREEHSFDEDRFTAGLTRMLWGLAKKCVVADRLALYVNQVYDRPFDHKGLPLVVATVFFAVQIYCDFSGYSDVALGSARTMGFRLMTNFDRPYGAESIPEFWRRWHVSLSTFFRDYLYIPLGGNQVSLPRWCFNIMVTFLVSGLWHGAAWTYVIWGGLHGFYMVCSRLTASARRAWLETTGLVERPILLRPFRLAWTFALTSFAWIFFRATSLAAALHVAAHLLDRGGDSPRLNLSPREFALSTGLAALVIVSDASRARLKTAFDAVLDSGWGRAALLLVFALAIFNLGVVDEIPFIYFQF